MPPVTKYESEKKAIDGWLEGNIGGPIMLAIIIGLGVVFFLAMFGVHV